MTAAETIEALITDAIRKRVFPGGVLLTADRHTIHRARSFGRLTYDPSTPRPRSESTLYDLASLTKPLATAALAALWSAGGTLDLDARLGELLPRSAGRPLGQVRLAHLLAHTSGLPEWRPLYRELLGQGLAIPSAESREALLALALEVPLQAEPGERHIYSDLDYLILGRVLERVGEQRLDVLLDTQLLRPQGIVGARTFNLLVPAEARQVAAGTVAPTERCPWRNHTLVAEVHDDNAWTGGGVEGHAGLFGTAEAALGLTRLWLHACHGEGVLAPVVARFLPEPPQRPLGWDRPSEQGSQGGAHLGPQDFGHLGFTGTSVWVEPEADRVVVLLTNRVHPDREDRGMADARRAIHDALYATRIEDGRA